MVDSVVIERPRAVPPTVEKFSSWWIGERSTRWGTAAAAAVVGIIGFFVARGSYFYADDFLFGNLFGGQELTAELLQRSIFGHLMPGFVLFDVVFYGLVGLSWAWAMVVMLLILAATTVGVVALLDATVGRRRINLLAGVLAAMSLGIVTTVTWWGAALTNMLPLAAGVAFLASATRWDTYRSKRYLFGAGFAYVVALAFNEKSLLFSVYAVLWSVFVLDIGRTFSERWRRCLRRWQLWLVVASSSLVVVAIYLSGSYRAESGVPAGLATSTLFVVRGVTLGLIPSLFGLDLQQPIWAQYSTFLAVATNALLLGVIVWTVRRCRRTIGVWAFALAATLVCQVPLAIGRAALLGADGGRSLRYQVDGSVFLVLAITIATVWALISPSRDQPQPVQSRFRSWLAQASVAVLFLGSFVAAWSASAAHSVATSPGTAGREWVGQLRTTWPGEAGPVVMIEGPMPDTFLFAWQYPYNLASFAMPQLVDNVEFTTDLAGAWAVDPAGGVGPVQFTAASRYEFGCTTDELYLAVDPSIDGPLHIVIGYRADAVGEVLVQAGPTGALGEPSGLGTPYEAQAGGGDLVAYWSGAAVLEQIHVASSVPGFCVDSISLGDAVGVR